MALHSSDFSVLNTRTLDRALLGGLSQTVEGGGVTWVIDLLPRDVAIHYIMDYDRTRVGEYKYAHVPHLKPHVIFKCIVDLSQAAIEIRDVRGNAIYIFQNINFSVVPGYAVLRWNDGQYWELA